MGTDDAADPAADSASETPTDPNEGSEGEQSFGEPARLRRPTTDEIADAIEATPTVEGARSPDLVVPSYLKKEEDSERMTGTVGKGEATPVEGVKAPGFTDIASDDPTVKAASLSAPVIPPSESPSPTKEGPSPLIFVALGLAVVAVALVMLLR